MHQQRYLSELLIKFQSLKPRFHKQALPHHLSLIAPPKMAGFLWLAILHIAHIRRIVLITLRGKPCLFSS